MNTDALIHHAGFLRSLARSLLIEDDRVDDVLQQTWLTAIERPPRDPRSLKSWLGTVTVNFAKKSLREESRRARREQATVRERAQLTPAQIVEREAAVRRLVDAVFSLPEPYRSVILLRYYDDAPPTEIARREGIPLETVRTRLKRGLQHLRKALGAKDPDADGGDSWRAAVLPVLGIGGSGSELPAAIGKALAGGIVGSTVFFKGAIAALVLVLTSAALLLTLGSRDDGTENAGPPAGNQPAPASVAASRFPGVLPAISTGEKEGEPTPPSESRRGALDVAIRWTDETPAAGILTRVYRYDASRQLNIPILQALEATTGAQGTILLEDLEPGRYQIKIDRGISTWVTVETGATRKITFTVPEGIEVKGIVLDPDGNPVPGAGLFMSLPHGEPGAARVATCGEDGRFRVRSLHPQSYLGARARGFGPSLLYPAPGEGSPRSFTLQLREPGGDVTGVVVDARGNPVQGAGVLLWKHPLSASRFDAQGRRYLEPDGLRARTDGSGEFQILDVPAGDWSLEVGALTFGPWKDEITVQSHTSSRIAVTLDAGAMISGKVTGPDGRPVAHARIDAHPERRLISELNGFLAGYTDASGDFRIGPVPPGSVELNAYSREHGRAVRQAFLEAGKELRWEARLDAGRAIRGLLVDEAAAPLPSWTVEISPLKDGFPTHPKKVKSGHDGRFRLANCRDAVYRLEVFEPGARGQQSSVPALILEEVRPRDEEMRLVVPRKERASAFIRGVLRTPAGHEGSVVGLQLKPASFHYLNRSIPEPGPFRLGPFVPGRYRLRVTSPRLGSIDLGDHELEMDGTLDLGEITLKRPGSVAVRLERADGEDVDLRLVGILDASLHQVCRLEVIDGSARSTAPLAPGDYYLDSRLAGFDQTYIPFRIVEGRPTRLDVRLEPATLCRFQPVLPDGAERPLRIESRIRNARGDIVKGKDFRFQGRIPGRHGCSLPAGLYTIEIRTDTGLRGEEPFEVFEGEPLVKPVEIPLR